ncbi:NAD-dependent epimerase/dehydratase family protein [Clostridium diolis]|uniref:NAD-dependent epimerase/dehydratase domain-containing protein n=1 Tax=Clostridium diolis TaxID=223919 RepID=A0AAV3VZ30_9CLOT|nr:NAD-dependent epimerase/dehydratase family protein [Clostridium diolis]QES72338.1 NAD-dependent epimerase/dehydratase family protein [Clostridium diolis]GEA30034.1 hypothetical protein CDIOL_09570 [Clostridium diolis]
MKILIIGGSGILSTDFTKKCLDENNDVYLVNRGKRKEFIDERANLIIADWRLESVDELKRKINLRKYDVVVDFLSFTVDQMKKTLSVIYKKFSQYIFISSATAYIKRNENEIISENTPVGNEKWDYAYNKSLCEKYLKDQDINYTIIRPYVTYGDSRIPFQIIPDGFNFTLIQRIIEDKPIVLLDGGSAICTLTHTIDFSEVLYKLLCNRNAYKEEFHITSTYTYTWREVYETLCEILRRKSKMFSISLEMVEKYIPEYYQILKGDKGSNMRFDNTKVMKAIEGYEFSISLSDGLRKSVNYFLENKKMQSIDYKWDGKIDYFIKKEIHYSTECIKGRNLYSNKVVFYYIMKYQPFRRVYELARKVKHIIK